MHERIEALFVASDGYFAGRRVQFATFATYHESPPAIAAAILSKSGDS
jgi:hypothetical protein